MIQNRQITLKRRVNDGPASVAEAVNQMTGKKALRWYVAKATQAELTIEAAICEEELKPFEARSNYYSGKSVVLNIVPTGVGSSIGGFAGDAAPVTNLLASTADYLVTNPNTVNASNFINLESQNILYTDGYSIDLFCKGGVDLHVPYANKVGLIVEKTDERSLDTVFNVVNAVRAVHGIDLSDVIITSQPIGSRCVKNASNAFVGTIDNPQVLFEACEKLVERGVNAIAMTTNVCDLPLDQYVRHFEGDYPNPTGGVEAILSYLVVNRFRLPAAHAPLINVKQLDLRRNIVDARGAGEISSDSGLACVLIGLKRAPQIAPGSASRITDVVTINNLMAVVTPASCLGGIPAIYAQQHGIPVIAVKENRTILDVTREAMQMDNVVEVNNYAEAAGTLLALKKGICLESLSRPLNTLRY